MDDDAIIIYSLILESMIEYLDDLPCIETHGDNDADDADITEHVRYGFGKDQGNQCDDQDGDQRHPLDKVFDGIAAEEQFFFQIEGNRSCSRKQRSIISQLDFIAYKRIVYTMIAIERLDISSGDDNRILRTGERFLDVDIYIQRIDESYAGLEDSSILKIFVGIAEKDVRWFHRRLCE